MRDKKEIFFEAYDLYADAIYRHCFFRVYSKERAEELVQDTFLKTWEYLEQGKSVENIRAFLYRVANNLVIDHSRKKKEQSVEAMIATDEHWEPAYDERGKIEIRVLFRDVAGIMEQLQPEDKEVIMMRYLDELEPREIADLLAITPNAASVRLNRALERLRNLLTAQGYHE